MPPGFVLPLLLSQLTGLVSDSGLFSVTEETNHMKPEALVQLCSAVKRLMIVLNVVVLIICLLCVCVTVIICFVYLRTMSVHACVCVLVYVNECVCAGGTLMQM